jgi:tRNA pseudouridine38-40 synthase
LSHIKNIKLILEYDGTNYSGWQVQNNAKTVQGTLENALLQLTKEKIKLIGASRTDSGVHAYGQVANFNTTSSIPAIKFSYALNHFLPKDIVVKTSTEESPTFHSRFSAKGKTYTYLIFNRNVPSPLFKNRACHVPAELSFEKMRVASKHFLGRHDFKGFRTSKCGATSTIKTIQSIGFKKEEDCIHMSITGDGFLYNMVRIIAGTLIFVGMNKIEPDEIPEIIESGERKKAGKTAPACGLYLNEIYY